MPVSRSVRGCVQWLALWLFAPVLGSCGQGGGWDDFFPLVIPTDVVVADIDGDGRADVLTLMRYSTDVNRSEGRLSVYRQTATGAFAAPDVYTVGVYPWRMRVADIDGDGLPDLVVGDADSDQVFWMRQDPSQPGRFESPVVVADGMHVEDVAVGDLNHDGAADLAIAECQRDANRVLAVYQDPAARGTFGPPVEIAAPGPSCALAVADIDGDGRDDLAGWFVTRFSTATTPGTGALGVAWQAADGSIGPVTTLASREGVTAVRLAAIDYFGDGAIAPIVYLANNGTGNETQVLVALHDPGSRTFTSFTGARLPGIQGIDDAAFADLDGDGHVDAVIAGFFPVGSPTSVESRANRLRQMGDGSLQIVGADSLPIAASRVAIGDLDGDGRMDIVLYGGDDQIVRMMQSHVTPGQFGAPLPLR